MKADQENAILDDEEREPLYHRDESDHFALNDHRSRRSSEKARENFLLDSSHQPA